MVHELGIHVLALNKVTCMHLVHELGIHVLALYMHVRTEEKLERLLQMGDMFEEIKDGRAYVGVTKHRAGSKYSYLRTA